MVRLLDDQFSKGFETVRLLVLDPRFTVELGDAIRAKGGVDRAIGAMNHEFFSTNYWYEKDGVIYLTVLADGTTGEQWVKRLEYKGFRLGSHARNLLLSRDFRISCAGSRKIAVLKGQLFLDEERFGNKIYDKAKLMNLLIPNTDIGCLIREQFTDKELEEMGLRYIVTMHACFGEFENHERFLTPSRLDGGNWLFACPCRQVDRLDHDCGFAFVVARKD